MNSNNKVFDIPLDKIVPDSHQPRRVFDEEKLRGLAKSIAQQGLIQPVLLRPKGGKYVIVHGERRFQAHKMLGLKTIRAEVRELTDREVLLIQLIENVQREDLNPIEEAETYLRMVNKLRLTHEEIAEKIGKSRTYITNKLRLLDLSPSIQEKIISGTLSQGHGEAILTVGNKDERERVAKKIIEERLSVKQSREMIKSRAQEPNVRRLTFSPRSIINNLKVVNLIQSSAEHLVSLDDLEQALISDLKTVRGLRIERLR